MDSRTNLQEPRLYLTGDGEATKGSLPHFVTKHRVQAHHKAGSSLVVGVERGLVRLELPAGPVGREWRREEKG